MSTPNVTETDPDRAARRLGSAATEDDPRHGASGRERSHVDVDLPEIDPDAYEILGEIARGGMGRISKARDRRLGRIVAVKQLIDPSPHLIALFEREVRITARLQHPSIVSLLEAGVLPSGELICVMKLVHGRALKEVLRDKLAVTERLAHLPTAIAIADALAYAHERGVIHRDLKPSNVLVGDYGEVVVIDWGLAHDGDPRDEPADDAAAMATGPAITARAMGTPAYMAPEAARGEAVDERADVYAIGAILYETLSGDAPYRGDDGGAILAAVRSGPPEPIARRVPGTPRDLAAIVDKAMARDRDARYPTARELADELRKFATGQLVSAHEYSLRERVWRWLRRNRAPVGVAAAAVAVVVTLVAVGLSRIVDERDTAADRADRLTLAKARLELDHDPVAALEALQDLRRDSPWWSGARTIAADAIARGIPRHVRLDAPAAAIALAGGHPRVAQRRDADIVVRDDRGPLATIAGRAAAIALSADGATLAAVGGDGHVRAWRLAAPQPQLVFDKPGPQIAALVTLASDGSAIAAGGRDFGIVSWRLADGAEVERHDRDRIVDRIAVAPDGRVAFAGANGLVVGSTAPRAGAFAGLVATRDDVIAAGADGAITFATAAASKLVGPSTTALAASADGALVAAAGDDGIAVLDRTGRLARTIATRHRARAIAIDPAGLVAIADGSDLWWWDEAAPDRTHLAGSTAPAVAIASARDRIAAACEDGSVWVWHGTDGRRLGAHAGAVRAIAIAPDGLFAVTTGDDRTVRRWPLDGGVPEIVGIHQGPGLAIAIAPDGRIASGGADRIVRIFTVSRRAGTDANGAVIGQHAGRIRALAFSDDGLRLASIGEDPDAMIWSFDGAPPRPLVHATPVTAIAWSDDALVTGTRDGTVTWWTPHGEPHVLAHHRGTVRSVAVARGHVASAGDDGRVGIGDATHLDRQSGHADLVRRVAFAPDGATLASASEDGTVRIWDTVTMESRAVAIAPWVADLAFAPDGTMLATAGADGGVWLVRDNLPRGRETLRATIDRVYHEASR